METGSTVEPAKYGSSDVTLAPDELLKMIKCQCYTMQASIWLVLHYVCAMVVMGASTRRQRNGFKQNR